MSHDTRRSFLVKAAAVLSGLVGLTVQVTSQTAVQEQPAAPESFSGLTPRRLPEVRWRELNRAEAMAAMLKEQNEILAAMPWKELSK